MHAVGIVVQKGRYFDEANFDVGGLVRMAHHSGAMHAVVRTPIHHLHKTG